MPEITIKDLDPREQKQIDNAQKALKKGNASHTINICTGILQRNPECLEVRKLLRDAQFHQAGGKTSGLTKFLSKVTSAPFAMKSGNLVKNDPKKGMEEAEKLLNANPGNPAANKTLAECATALELHETAVFAYETIFRAEPQNVENMVHLGNALIAAGRPQEAIKYADRARKLNPNNAEADELAKRASVAHSIEKGKWEEEGDYREKLADENTAVELEQAARNINDEETLTTLIEKAKKKLENAPDDVNIYREISNLYKQMEKYDEAIDYIQQARQLPKGKADSTLERTESDLVSARWKKDISDLEAALEAEPDNAEIKSKLEQTQAEFNKFRMEQTAALVERYPNDYGLRYEYGELLFQNNQADLAAREFQLAQRNPKVRLKALLYLGKAFKQSGKYDLAADQLESAKKESHMMDNFKKEVVYELAGCYELMGETEKAINEYKIIYSADIGYRDVADKINAFYERR